MGRNAFAVFRQQPGGCHLTYLRAICGLVHHEFACIPRGPGITDIPGPFEMKVDQTDFTFQVRMNCLSFPSLALSSSGLCSSIAAASSTPKPAHHVMFCWSQAEIQAYGHRKGQLAAVKVKQSGSNGHAVNGRPANQSEWPACSCMHWAFKIGIENMDVNVYFARGCPSLP